MTVDEMRRVCGLSLLLFALCLLGVMVTGPESWACHIIFTSVARIAISLAVASGILLVIRIK